MVARRLVLLISLLLTSTLVAGERRPARHWAFQAVRRPTMPAVRGSNWVRTPIDAFVLAKLEAAGLKPASRADTRTLLRRVYLDLIGLPPTPAEIEAFLHADSKRSPGDNPFAKVVDQLLARSEYGERWARHWLDVARYADTNGYERDGAKPNAWRYRDYVIDALNRDKPYDRFVQEQVAGDELADADAASMIATTFLRLGTWDDEPANAKVDRYDQLDDVLGTTATAFLGLTLRCARCHDHKFEPFSQVDYYRMLAVFEPLRRPQNNRTDLDRPVGTREALRAHEQAAALYTAKVAEVQKRLDEIDTAGRGRVLGGKTSFNTTLPAEALAAFRLPEKQRDAKQKMLVKTFTLPLNNEVRSALTGEERQRRTELEKQRAALDRAKPPDLPRAYIWYEDGPQAPPTHVLKRGNPEHPAVEVAPGLPVVLTRQQPAVPTPTDRSTGRRLWLARWLTGRDNPLTARVMVNRVWQHHFGVGLVATANDFGVMGTPPSHPELLDWLADRFMADGWRLKNLHRLIVLSSAYQAASISDSPSPQRQQGPSADAPQGQPDDARLALFGRWRPRRLEAEAIRDSVLAVSGQLNPKRGGPGVYPHVPAAVLAGQSRPGEGWGKSDNRESSRRSVYVYVKRSVILPELELLDAPDNTCSCERRPVSTTAPQALTFLNGSFLTEQSRIFADRLVREAGTDQAAQVTHAFQLALARPAAAEERERCLSFLSEQQARLAAAEPKLPAAERQRRALATFCLVLLNTNEFFYLG